MTGLNPEDGTAQRDAIDRGAPGPSDAPASSLLSRRSFLIGAVSALAAGGAVSYGDFDTFDLELVEMKVNVPGLPKELSSYRVGFLTDLHLGISLPSEFISQAVNVINQAQVDLVLLGGDYIWLPDTRIGRGMSIRRNFDLGPIEKPGLARDIFALLAKLLSGLRARDGIYAVLGNHDRWIDPQGCEAELSAYGINFLTNRSVEVRHGDARLTVTGTDDFWTGLPRLNLPPKKAPGEARLILSHNPDFFSYLLRAGSMEFDLGLSGHTHGGQIRLPLLGAMKYNVMDRRLREGLFSEGQRNVYTSRGLGFIEVPYRFNCRPEATVITLLPA